MIRDSGIAFVQTFVFFFSSRRRHTRCGRDWSSDVCSSDLGARVLVLENDHSSAVLEWMTRASAGGFTVETVRRPGNGDWTEALLTAKIGRASCRERV